jgi:long-subunit acyl-CoA synthetase (AMP-forming)
VFGDARPYNVALIVLDSQAAGRLADPAVLLEVDFAVARANEAMDERERVVRHIVLPTTWAPGGDMLTPTAKLRRRTIAAAYAAEIEALYAG